MTGHQKFKFFTLTFIFLSSATIIYPFLTWDFFETGPIILWTLRWTSIPIFITTLVLSYVIDRHILAPEDPPLQSQIKSKLRRFFSVTMLAVGWTMILIGIVFSLIVTSNNLFPRRHILVSAPVTDYHLETTRNGRQVHHIDFFEKNMNRNVHLTVERPYHVHEIFEKELDVGHWGFLFTKD